MKEIKITESTMGEALTQIDTLEELSTKDRGCLRLLAEEMFSMCRELLDTETLDFEIKHEDNKYVLRALTKTQVNEKAREHFLSISSTGKNAANKGVKGILGAVLEALCFEDNPDYYGCGLGCVVHAGGGYAYMWTLSNYIQATEQQEIENEWDGMEKSIIANFADDVSIGVRSGKLEMTVTKGF